MYAWYEEVNKSKLLTLKGTRMKSERVIKVLPDSYWLIRETIDRLVNSII